MTGLLLILLLSVFAVFPVILVTAALKKRTVPVADEVTVQFAGESSIQHIEKRSYLKPPVRNNHWYRHTFERPRKRG